MHQLREWLQRLWGTIRRRRSDADLEEELRLHMALAAEDAARRGDAEDAGRAARLRTGGVPQALEALRDQRGLPWLDAVAADVTFGWRQLNKHRAASAAAVLSLGLAVGGTTAAFKLVDAVLLRPLPVADPDRLFAVSTTFVDADNRPDYMDDFDYPTYRAYSAAVGDHADVMILGLTARQVVTLDAAGDPEPAFRQFVSGNVFGSLGLRPALGRLIGPSDDVTPGAHAVAVVSHDYWTRRFARDPSAIGRTLRLGSQQFEIIGVAPEGFTGTEPGNVTDLFIPATMNVQALNSPGWSWFRLWVRPKPGVGVEQVRQMLQARFRADQQARLRSFAADTPKARIDAHLREEVRLLKAGAGVSGVQKTFRRPLIILATLAGLVLLVACANVANLLVAQAMARRREMALRLSIGASRGRLIQLVLIESALLAAFASAAGALFASWSAPLVVSLLSQANRPVRLVLDADWRVFAFGLGVTLAITLLFGLAPALRASSVRPVGALKGDENPRAERRLTNVLIAGQMAFCMFLLFTAGLFIATFDRLVKQPLGFSHQNVILLPAESRAKHQPGVWKEIADGLRGMPGVESAAAAGWAPLTGNRWRLGVRTGDLPFPPNSPYFVDVSSGYFTTLRMEMLDGRDFLPSDAPPRLIEQRPAAGVGIVNEAFARSYFGERSPVGQTVRVRPGRDGEAPMEIVGLVRNAVYDSVREPMRPIVYVPMDSRNNATFIVRTSGDPVPHAPGLSRGAGRGRPDVRVRGAEPFSAFVKQQMIRERLLALLSSFFAVVALLLAGIGLYGVLNYAVIRQRREIGIRMALGARAAHVASRVAAQVLALVGIGAMAGLAGGIGFGRVVDALLFQVKPTDPSSVLAPVLALAAVALLAALPAAVRAVRTDPAQTLRAE